MRILPPSSLSCNILRCCLRICFIPDSLLSFVFFFFYFFLPPLLIFFFVFHFYTIHQWHVTRNSFDLNKFLRFSAILLPRKKKNPNADFSQNSTRAKKFSLRWMTGKRISVDVPIKKKNTGRSFHSTGKLGFNKKIKIKKQKILFSSSQPLGHYDPQLIGYYLLYLMLLLRQSLMDNSDS